MSAPRRRPGCCGPASPCWCWALGRADRPGAAAALERALAHARAIGDPVLVASAARQLAAARAVHGEEETK